MPVGPHAAHMANDGASCDRQESDKRDDEEGGNQSPSSHADSTDLMLIISEPDQSISTRTISPSILTGNVFMSHTFVCCMSMPRCVMYCAHRLGRGSLMCSGTG